ncbi:MAG: GspE/PulE family protein [Rikenellaceae bacterium]|jgi:general secretion pathway protein E/type IV pilus assembly protein PilB|nr:GspE/PulE family protein [Rikenellaceae bacterium]
MKGEKKITAEILQQLIPSQAWEYRLMPYGEAAGTLLCYGDAERDWDKLAAEVQVIIGRKIRVTPTEKEEVLRLLKQHYRQQRGSAAAEAAAIPGEKFLMRLIGEAHRGYASDIHFEIYEERCRVRMRIDGRLVERYVIERHNYPALVNQIKILANLDISEKRLPQDGRIFYRAGDERFDVRVSCLPTIYGEKVVLRLLTRHVELLDLENLGFSEKQLSDYIRAVQRPHGLVLISGPTGSGKSTTLYATLRLLNRETGNILTIEDPVEYTLPGVNQVQLKEEIGLTFGSTLRTFLRQDPDIIMLGEIRDADTAQMAIRSSLTGHLIFSTIHTNSAWGSVARLIDMGAHPYLISGTLILCVAQRLVRLLCPACRERVAADATVRRQVGESFSADHHYRAVGCENCYYTGYKGRKAIYEVIPVDRELSEAIRTGHDDIGLKLSQRGIVTLREAALVLFRNGETSLEELLPQLQ